jgi:hypothetical protein
MTEPRICKHCGHAILSRSHANAKFCSRECFSASQRKSHERAQQLRYGPVKPLASRREFAIGQRVSVPSVVSMTIGGEVKDVRVSEVGTVRAVDGETVTVSVGGATHICTREQLAASAPGPLAVRYGHGMSLGGQNES